MVERWTNNAIGTLAAGIGAGDLALSLDAGQGALFPALSSGDHFWAVLEEGGTLYRPTLREIIRCTARTVDALTIQRGQQGTIAQAFGAGARCEHRITRTTLEDLRDGLIETTPFARRIPPAAFVGAGTTSTDVWGLWATGTGTAPATATLATSNQLTQQYHAYHSSTAAAAGIRGALPESFLRGATPGIGGFRCEGKLTLDVNNDGCRMFVGLVDSPGAFLVATTNPGAAAVALFGFGFDSTSLAVSGNLRLFHHDGVSGVTSVDTGIPRTQMATELTYFCIRADPASGTIRAVAQSLVSGVLYDAEISTNLPPALTPLQWQTSILGNGAANSIRLGSSGSVGYSVPV